MFGKHFTIASLPVVLAATALLFGGIFLLERSEAQARDTIRKHHLVDVEQALLFAGRIEGTYPPYDQATWCGQLSDPRNRDVRDQVEAALRAQHEKYANSAKPFPEDPRYGPTLAQDLTRGGYFYWKRSPALFELYSALEADSEGTFSTEGCPGSISEVYEYGLNLRVRQTNGDI